MSRKKIKVYVCWTIPDSIGINIEDMFLREVDAKAFCDEYKKTHEKYDQCDYDEYEVK